MMKFTKNRKGMTLIELVIAAAIVGAIMMASITVLMTSIKTYNTNFNNTVGQQNLRSAMMTITKQVRNPNSTSAVTGSNVLTVNGKNFTVSSGSLQYNGQIYASNIASIKAGYTDASQTVIQVDLTASDGSTLSTQISLN